MDHANAALVHDFYEARASGDADRIGACLTDDVVWRYPGRNPLAGEYRGRDQVTAFFARVRELTGDDFSTEARHVLTDDDVAMILELPRGKRGGRTLHWKTVLLARIRGGRIAEVTVFQHTQYELDEWWTG
ncbi:hypothetical protein BH20ACT9_BH20ACT9_18790 [soil metagenome]